jgi:CubicO group peptidase (beta-lactamase class C family)
MAPEFDPQRLSKTIQGLVDDLHLPGISIGVVRGRELVFAEGFGFADIESQRPQSPDLRQRIGSITKTMVALSTMALAEEGKLSLEDRVADHLPEIAFEGDGDSLTIRHLITHTGGIGEAPTPRPPGQILDALWSYEPDSTPVLEQYPDGILLEVEPGTKWCYANHGFFLLGEILRKAEGGLSIDEVLRKRIFDPLGMSDTDIADAPHPKLTTGYHRVLTPEEAELGIRAQGEAEDEEPVDGHNIRGRHLYIKGRAAGSVQSTIPDMAKYASTLLARGAGIVTPKTFETMVSPQWCPDRRLQHIGISFFLEPRFGRMTFGHGGGVGGGWNTMLTVVPEEDLALIVHLNLTSDLMARVEGSILRAVLGESRGELPQTPPDDTILAAAPGVYEATPGTLTNFRIMGATGRIQLRAEDGHLMLYSRRGKWKEGVRMVPTDSGDPTFFTLDTDDVERPQAGLVRDSHGDISGLRFDRLVAMMRSREKGWVE